MLQASQDARASLDKIMGHGGSSENGNDKSAPRTNDTPSQICKAYEENEVRAAKLYYDKKISFKGKLLNFIQVGYSGAVLSSGTSNIMFISEKSNDFVNLKKGNYYQATGVIRDIQPELSLSSKAKCQIIIKGLSIN